MVKKVRDKAKLQKTDKDQQPSFVEERRNTGLLDLPKGRRISDTDVFEMESSPSSFQRKEAGGNCNGLIVWLGSSAVRVLAR